ncbi:hypothetical protein EVAR_66702_1 [Eumeta japonica]|uniref:Uncharacterized protein n=1 Tax=Eumeta variegata TaxID=151549 RepID=A0A4C1ZR16_EUMVA|nr:hypothetical protein EVAR_66702_1 [Eumeta japonica]
MVLQALHDDFFSSPLYGTCLDSKTSTKLKMLVHESIDSQLERIYTMLDFLSPPQTEGDKQLVKILTAELSRITMQFRLK